MVWSSLCHDEVGIFRAFGDKESTVHTGGLLLHFIFYCTLIGFFSLLVFLMKNVVQVLSSNYQNELEKTFRYEVLSFLSTSTSSYKYYLDKNQRKPI